MDAEVPRVATGIPGFDKLIEGGFPKNFVILLAGTPGTGKSIFSLEYIYNGAASLNENGVYITLEQKVENLKKQALQFGWDFDELEKKEKVVIEKMDEFDVGITIKKIKKSIEKINAKRLVVDSLSGILAQVSMHRELFSQVRGMYPATGAQLQMTQDKESMRKVIWDIFMRLSDLNCTTLIPSEIPVGTEQLSSDGVSEFACDGVILLKKLTMGREGIRTVSVEKMRSTKIDEAKHDLQFTKKGIIVGE